MSFMDRLALLVIHAAASWLAFAGRVPHDFDAVLGNMLMNKRKSPGPPRFPKRSPKIDVELSKVHFVLRTLEQSVADGWSAMLADNQSETLKGLDDTEKQLLIGSFTIGVGNIFDAGAADAIVSPANSFGDMTGGIDLVYSKRFGWDMMVRLMEKIQGPEFNGELLVGQAAVVRTNNEDPIRYLISAPTMRVPRDVHDTVNAYLAFRAVLIAVRKHNLDVEKDPSSGTPILRVLVPGLGTGIGLMPPATCGYQMAMAYRQQVLGRVGELNSGTLDHIAMLKQRPSK